MRMLVGFLAIPTGIMLAAFLGTQPGELVWVPIGVTMATVGGFMISAGG